MSHIVHGATGAQGSPVLAALTSAGLRAIAAVRDASALPDGVESITVDFADARSLASAYAGADGVFVHLPLGESTRIVAYAEAIVRAVAEAKPGRVVVSTSGQIVDGPGSFLRAGPESPIMILIRGVEASGVSSAVVAPRLFLENLLLPPVADAVRREGILRYPLPDAYPVSWASHADVAQVVANLLTDHSTTGLVAVGHLPGLTGSDLAAGFCAHLSEEVRFEPVAPKRFGELVAPLFGQDVAASVAGLYEALERSEGNVIGEANSAQRLLGLSPLTVADWLARVDF